MKPKKVTFGKSFDNLTKHQFDFLQNIKGGTSYATSIPAIPVPNDDIHIPTGAGGRRCDPGLVWSYSLRRCVAIAHHIPGEDK